MQLRVLHSVLTSTLICAPAGLLVCLVWLSIVNSLQEEAHEAQKIRSELRDLHNAVYRLYSSTAALHHGDALETNSASITSQRRSIPFDAVLYNCFLPAVAASYYYDDVI
jgi:hypothetical protein